MTWRYQPVWVGTPEDPSYSLAEVYLDAEGRLENWTQDPAMRAIGNSIPDLIGALALMIGDAAKYKPVAFSSLAVGMVFERVEE